MTIRPALPRSLDPLPNESLPGFLLRLSHRLGLSPADLTIHLGLPGASGGGLVPSRLFALQEHEAQTVAVMTGLNLQQVTDLRLSSITGRYLPMTRKRNQQTRQLKAMLIKENWINNRSSRYCPQCLAGDPVSPIQQRHGGGWNKLWRLPVIFACVAHQQLLHHLCPPCQLPAHHRSSKSPVLLPLASHPGLHPNACRNEIHNGHAKTPCGHRLDTSTPQRAGRQLLHLQAKFDELLRPDAPGTTHSIGHNATTSAYFTDLRIVSCLITATWPAARHLATTSQATLITAHARRRSEQITAAQATGRAVRQISFWDRPPSDSRTCAALLGVADAILASTDVDQTRTTLRPLFAAAPKTLRTWTNQFVNLGQCSPGFGAAAGTEVNRTRSEQFYGRPKTITPPPQDVQFGIQHIPQLLPQAWFDQFFDQFRHIHKPRLLRRVVSIRLLQLCVGGRPFTISPLLGIPGTAANHALRATSNYLEQLDPGNAPAQHQALARAIEALAKHLNTALDRIDYGQRRQQLANWSLSHHEWRELTEDLRANERSQWHWPTTHWGEGKRLLASTWIWTHVTQGEHVFAPQLRDPTKTRPGGDQGRYVYTRLHLLEAGREGHYIELRKRLHTYATNLATTIDTGQFPPQHHNQQALGLTPEQLARRH